MESSVEPFRENRARVVPEPSKGGTRLEDTMPETVLEARPGWRLPEFGEIWRYRELLYFFVWRDLKVRYKQAVLGVAWSVLQPLALMIVFTMTFGKLGERAARNIPDPLFFYSGLLPWLFFSNAVTAASMSVVGSQDLVTKIYFPRILIPVGTVLASVVDFIFAFGMFVALLMWYALPAGAPSHPPDGRHKAGIVQTAQGATLPESRPAQTTPNPMNPLVNPNAWGADPQVHRLTSSSQATEPQIRVGFQMQTLFFPFPLIGLFILALGVGTFLSALTVKYRDFRYVVPFGVQLWMFVTPTIYMWTWTEYNPRWRFALALNPADGFITAFRNSMVGAHPVDYWVFNISFMVSLFIFVMGCLYFRRVERDFADII